MKHLILGLFFVVGAVVIPNAANAEQVSTIVATDVQVLVKALQTSQAGEARSIMSNATFAGKSLTGPALSAFLVLHADVKKGTIKIEDIKQIAESSPLSMNETLLAIRQMDKKSVSKANFDQTPGVVALRNANEKGAAVNGGAPTQRVAVSTEGGSEAANVELAKSKGAEFFASNAVAADAVAKATAKDCTANECVVMAAAAGRVIGAAEAVCNRDSKSCTQAKQVAADYVGGLIVPLAQGPDKVSPANTSKLPAGIFEGKLTDEKSGITFPALVSGAGNMALKGPKNQVNSIATAEKTYGKQLTACILGQAI